MNEVDWILNGGEERAGWYIKGVKERAHACGHELEKVEFTLHSGLEYVDIHFMSKLIRTTGQRFHGWATKRWGVRKSDAFLNGITAASDSSSYSAGHDLGLKEGGEQALRIAFEQIDKLCDHTTATRLRRTIAAIHSLQGER